MRDNISNKDLQNKHVNINWPVPRLRHVLQNLKETNDVEGALLVEGKEAILVSAFPKITHYEAEIPKILSLLDNCVPCPTHEPAAGMFAQEELYYNGFKILSKRLGYNLTLLVMLKKSGYTSLVMLDIENSVNEIEKIIRQVM